MDLRADEGDRDHRAIALRDAPEPWHAGSIEQREVTVHGLQVQGTLVDWPEKGQRKRAWRPIDEAVALVGEPGLAELLRSLRPDRASLPDFLRRDPKTGELPADELLPATAESSSAIDTARRD